MNECTICGNKTKNEFCKQCQFLITEGYIACIGVDPEKSKVEQDRIKPSGAYRTGNIMWIRKEVTNALLGFEPGENERLLFIEEKYITKLTNSDDYPHKRITGSDKGNDPAGDA